MNGLGKLPHALPVCNRFPAKDAKSAKELERFSRRLHLRPSAASAVENPELPRHGNFFARFSTAWKKLSTLWKNFSIAWKFRIFSARVV
jgi:hypothetical protein